KGNCGSEGLHDSARSDSRSVATRTRAVCSRTHLRSGSGSADASLIASLGGSNASNFPSRENDTFSDIQEQQKAFLEAKDACKISAWVVGFRLTIPRLSDQSTGA